MNYQSVRSSRTPAMTPFHIAESGLTEDKVISLLCASDPLTRISLSLSFLSNTKYRISLEGY
jgi:hypothetical protein